MRSPRSSALRLARERGAYLLELRAAVDLARRQGTQGQPVEARKVLAPVYGLFTEAAMRQTCRKPARCWRAWTGSGGLPRLWRLAIQQP